MHDEKVLSQIYLDAVLPSLEMLTTGDAAASAIALKWTGDIRFSIGVNGPRSTLSFHGPLVKHYRGKTIHPDIILFFPSATMLNNLFRNKGVRIAIPTKGITKLNGLVVFSSLAKYMDKVLNGEAGSVDLRAKLTLNIIARAIAIIASYDNEAKLLRHHLNGIAELRIKEGDAVHVDFTSLEPKALTGHAACPDFILEFATNELFLRVAEDTVDVLVEACLENIVLKGNIHMGQILNILLDKIGHYLQKGVRP